MAEGVIKDSRYSWLLCAIGTLNLSVWSGFINIFGVFFVELIKDFGGTKSNIAWLGSATCGIHLAFGPVAGRLRISFGDRIIIIVGCLTCAMSLLVSSFVDNWKLMFVTYSFVYGIGSSLAAMCTSNIPEEYFDKHVSVATGFVVSGSSLGTLVHSFVSQKLIDAMGWRNTWRLFVAFLTVIACLGYLFKPSQKEQATATMQVEPVCQSLPLWRNRVYVLWVFAISLVMFGYYVPYVYLVSYAIELGISPDMGASLVAILGGVSAFGRIAFGKIINVGVLHRLHMHQLAMIVTGTATIMLPVMTSYAWLVFYVVLIGLVDGCHVVLLPILTSSFAGSNRLTTALGIMYCVSSVTFTLGPPIAGWLYEYSGSYSVPFHICGIPVLLSSAVLFFMPWAQRTTAINARQGSVYSKFETKYTDVDFPPINPAMVEDRTEKYAYESVDMMPEIVHNHEIHIQIHDEPDLTKGCSVVDSLQQSQPISASISIANPQIHALRSYNASENIFANDDTSQNEIANKINDRVSESIDTSEVNRGIDQPILQHVIIPDSVVEVLASLARKDESDLSTIKETATDELLSFIESEKDQFSQKASPTTDENTISNGNIFRKLSESHGEAVAVNNIDAGTTLNYIANDDASCISSRSQTSISKELFLNRSSTLSNPSFDFQPTAISDNRIIHTDLTSHNTLSALPVISDSVAPLLDVSATKLCETIVSTSNAGTSFTLPAQERRLSISEVTEENVFSQICMRENMSHENLSNSIPMPDIVTESLEYVNIADSRVFEEIPISYVEEFEPRATGNHYANVLSGCIDENLLFNPSNIYETKSKSEALTESESTVLDDISHLAAENLAQFEVDLGIIPTSADFHSDDISDHAYEKRDEKLSGFDGRELPDILLNEPFSDGILPVHHISTNEAQPIGSGNITTDLVAENLAQFGESIGMVPLEVVDEPRSCHGSITDIIPDTKFDITTENSTQPVCTNPFITPCDGMDQDSGEVLILNSTFAQSNAAFAYSSETNAINPSYYSSDNAIIKISNSLVSPQENTCPISIMSPDQYISSDFCANVVLTEHTNSSEQPQVFYGHDANTQRMDNLQINTPDSFIALEQRVASGTNHGTHAGLVGQEDDSHSESGTLLAAQGSLDNSVQPQNVQWNEVKEIDAFAKSFNEKQNENDVS